MTAPFPPDETSRLEVLRRYEVLDTPPEAAFERVTALAARLFAAPIVLVTMLDENRQWHKSVRGIDHQETARDVAFCSHTILGDEILVVPDATLDARFADLPSVTGSSHFRFYAGAPLRTAGGYRLGALCVIDTVPRPAGLSAEDRAVLTALAATVVDALELRLALRHSREAVEGHQKKEEQIAIQARQQATVARFGQRALELAGSSLNELLTEAADLVAGTLGADFVTVFEHVPERGVLIRRAGYGWPEDALCRVETGALATLETPAGCTLLTGRPVISEDITKEPRIRMSPYAQRHGVVAVADVIIAREAPGPGPAPAPFGVLSALFRQPHVFSPEDVAFLQAMANTLASAVARQRAEATIRQAREEAEQANAAKSDFLSRMSHELRTPLNAILGFGQLLEMDTLARSQGESVAQILKGGRHLLGLIDEVLDITRLETGRLGLTIEPVRVGEVLKQALVLVKPLAARRAVTFSDHSPGGGDALVLADPQRLKQVLLNLLSNAVKHNREGGRVMLDCRPVAGAGQVRVSVRDTGPGIAPESLSRLFVPFERLDAAKRGVDGVGIGLAICQGLVAAMGGGNIEVDSVLGRGTTFTFELPAAPSSASPVNPAVSGGADAAKPSAATRTVLHIEDHPAYQILVEHVLRQRPDCQLLTTMQGRMGLDMAHEYRPDLILLDLELPDLPGEEVLRHLRTHPRTLDIPVIVLSGDSTPRHMARMLELGARHYLTKPLETPALLRALEETLPGRTPPGHIVS